MDASPPYRVFIDPRRYRKGETLQVVAAARSLDGTVTLSPVIAAKLPGS